MESNIEILLKESLSLAEKKFKKDNVIEQYEKAMKEFKELVKMVCHSASIPRALTP